MAIDHTTFWVALVQIIGVNLVLSGDNAVVIALAARSLPSSQQGRAIFWGSGAAVVMRIILTVVAVEMLRLPYLKLIGAALLLWIGVKLLLPEDDGDDDAKLNSGPTMMAAIRTILIADLVMSLDNVIAVAAAAKGSLLLLILGLAISIPLVIFGSTLLLKIMQRFPVVITLGAGLLGWVAGEMAVTDPIVTDSFESLPWLHTLAPLAGAAFVVAIGKWRGVARAEAQTSAEAATQNRSSHD
ncbi:MAG: TerC family protein [Sulfurifustis sp.]